MADRYTRNDDPDRRVPDENPRVAPLHDVDDFQVADGYPDPRGWDVMAADGKKIGKVHDLIVDTGQLRTRYLDVSLDKDAVGTPDDRDVLIPIGAAQLDDSADHVVLGAVTTAQIAALPEFRHDRITREYENSVLERIPVVGAARPSDAYYGTEHFDDRRFYANRSTREMPADAGMMNTAALNDSDRVANTSAESDLSRNDNAANETRVTRSEEDLDIEKRQVRAGEVEVRKHVDTEHVSRPVILRHEEVTIERRPLSADQAAGAVSIGEDNEIRIPIAEEQLVVEKRVVPKEELVITKHTSSKEQTVEADVRKERVDVDRSHERDASPNADGRSDNR